MIALYRITLLYAVIAICIAIIGASVIMAQPWCSRAENDTPVKYYISTTLSYIVYQNGWNNLLNNDVIRASANSWNNVRDESDLWPVLENVAWGEWDIYVTLSDTDPCDDTVLGVYDREEDVLYICQWPFENNYYSSVYHVRFTISHEFGHALGAYHITNTNKALMYPDDGPYKNYGIYTPQQVDQDHLNNVYETECSSSGGGGGIACDQPPYICSNSRGGW